MRLSIGPKSATSVTPGAKPSDVILKSKQDLPLTVVLFCGFCEPQADSVKRITYAPSRGASDEAVFQFTPQKRVDGYPYIGQLQLGVVDASTGRDYDRLVVDVAITDSRLVQDKLASPPATTVDAYSNEASSDWRPDVVLYATEEFGRSVSIQVEPISEEMKRRLNLAVGPDGEPRKFRSGVDDVALVNAMTSTAYGAMSAVGLQGPALLKVLSAAGVDASISKASRESLQLSESEQKKVTEILADAGQRLYRHLFADSPDADLRQLIVELESAAAEPGRTRPLRLRIYTTSISLPWQYIHPVGPNLDATKFWGLRFSLSVTRVNTGARARAAISSELPHPKVVFARYGKKDETVDLANKQEIQLSSLPIANNSLLIVDSGADLLGILEAQRKEISALFAFLHAASATQDSEPFLAFNDGDIVTSDRLERLLNRLPMEEQGVRYLASAPLIILNACETGPSVNMPHVTLENAMFQLGARGVVVTEVSVWIPLGHEMATRLIKRLGNREPISDALTAVRKDLYADKNNPLGLLYSYYGDPAATFRY
jgi:hypothetical protein